LSPIVTSKKHRGFSFFSWLVASSVDIFVGLWKETSFQNESKKNWATKMSTKRRLYYFCRTKIENTR
jgi:hypothetical protein